jgi:D-3-phosphoglycerate dehydrogenase
MKKKNISIAVCSRSVSKNIPAVKILKKYFKTIKLNNSNKILKNDELYNFLNGVEGTIIGLEKVDKIFLNKCPKLRVIGKYGVGTNNIDFKELNKSKTKILLQPGINKRAVSEIVLNFIITSLRNTNNLINDVKSNKWPFTFGRLLSGKTVGIIGFGNIGSDLYKLLKPFGCKILVNDINKKNKFNSLYKIKNSNIKNLLVNSDIISIHIPLNKNNYFFFSKEQFNLLKKNVTLVNTSRGGIVDEKYLYKFLKSKTQSNAFFDVMLNEPITNKKLLNLKNFYLTPHLAGSTVETVEVASIDCAKKIINFFD